MLLFLVWITLLSIVCFSFNHPHRHPPAARNKTGFVKSVRKSLQFAVLQADIWVISIVQSDVCKAYTLNISPCFEPRRFRRLHRALRGLPICCRCTRKSAAGRSAAANATNNSNTLVFTLFSHTKIITKQFEDVLNLDVERPEARHFATRSAPGGAINASTIPCSIHIFSYSATAL